MADKPGADEDLDALIEQGEELYFDGDYEEAERVLERVRRELEAREGETLRLASALNVLAGIYRETDREEEAIAFCRRAFAIMERECEPGDDDMAGVARNIGQIYRLMGNTGEALQWFEKALAVHEAADPEEADPSGMAQTLRGLAGTAKDIADSEQRLACLSMALNKTRELKVRDLDARIAIAYSDSLLDIGRAEEAREVVESLRDEYVQELSDEMNPWAVINPESMTFEMIKKEFKEEHREPPCLLLLRVQLAKISEALGGADGSPVSELPAMGTFEGRIYGEDSPFLAHQYEEIGVALHLMAQGTGKNEHFAKAEEFYRNALTILKKQCDEDDPALLQVRANLAELYEDTGRNPAEVE